MARELAPAGLRSSPNLVTPQSTWPTALHDLGPLRSPAGASSLATRAVGGVSAKQMHALTSMNQTLKKPVGASLLAIAVHQSTSMLPDLAPSRAGSLPQGNVFGQSILLGFPHPYRFAHPLVKTPKK